MNLFFYTTLFLFGTLFGSFSSVIIYRIKSEEGGILTGRSHCNNCNKILKALDLIPIISFLKNKGKCNYCKKKVSSIYPILEIISGTLFALIGFFLIDFSLILNGNVVEIIKMFFFLIIGFFTVVYSFYDILFLEIPESILAFGIGLTFIIISLQTIFPGIFIIPNIPSNSQNLSIGLLAIALSITILTGLYVIMLKGLNEIFDIIIIVLSILSLLLFKNFYSINLSDIAIFNSLLGALGIFIFFFLQIIISKGAWMGGGDLRIAILIGLILGYGLYIPGTMLTYIVGSIFGIIFLIYSKIKNNGCNSKTQIPFGPFLAIGFFLTLFLQNNIEKIIKIYFYAM